MCLEAVKKKGETEAEETREKKEEEGKKKRKEEVDKTCARCVERVFHQKQNEKQTGDAFQRSTLAGSTQTRSKTHRTHEWPHTAKRHAQQNRYVNNRLPRLTSLVQVKTNRNEN